MKINRIALTCVMLLIVTINAIAGLEDKEINFPSVEGLKIEKNYPKFTPDDLWDYINGASDTYLSYKFKDLVIAEYMDGGQNSLKVEIYRHASPEFAYGIYSQERSPYYQFTDIGFEGYEEATLVYFVTGPYYVKVMTNSGDPEFRKYLPKVASLIDKELADSRVDLPMLSAFPGENRVPWTETFISTNFLGHEFLSEVYVADYEIGQSNGQIFLITRNSQDEIDNIIKSYCDFAKIDVPEGNIITIDDKYNGIVKFYRLGKILAGFYQIKDQKLIDNYVKIIEEKLK